MSFIALIVCSFIAIVVICPTCFRRRAVPAVNSRSRDVMLDVMRDRHFADALEDELIKSIIESR